jgi:hypothetical protein
MGWAHWLAGLCLLTHARHPSDSATPPSRPRPPPPAPTMIDRRPTWARRYLLAHGLEEDSLLHHDHTTPLTRFHAVTLSTITVHHLCLSSPSKPTKRTAVISSSSSTFFKPEPSANAAPRAAAPSASSSMSQPLLTATSSQPPSQQMLPRAALTSTGPLHLEEPLQQPSVQAPAGLSPSTELTTIDHPPPMSPTHPTTGNQFPVALARSLSRPLPASHCRPVGFGRGGRRRCHGREVPLLLLWAERPGGPSPLSRAGLAASVDRAQ